MTKGAIALLIIAILLAACHAADHAVENVFVHFALPCF